MIGIDPLKKLRIVLCGANHPSNIGATARAMKMMGLSRIYLVVPERFPDPEAEWRAARATTVLARATVCANVDEALADVAFADTRSARSRELAVPQVAAREGAQQVVDVARVRLEKKEANVLLGILKALRNPSHR